jgi:hypothetical protein
MAPFAGSNDQTLRPLTLAGKFPWSHHHIARVQEWSCQGYGNDSVQNGPFGSECWFPLV